MRHVYVHGWSYDAQFWASLRAHLRQPDDWLIEQGYFGALRHLTLPDERFIAITHSAGLMWLLMQDLRHCQAIIAVNGFARFSASSDGFAGVPPRLLDRMRQGLDRDPHHVLKTFRHRVGDETLPPPAPSTEVLDAGLALLRDGDCRPQAREHSAQITLITGAADPIVTGEMSPQRSCPGMAEHYLPGGHLLPLTAPSAVAALISLHEKARCS